jgi:hypothetical protein
VKKKAKKDPIFGVRVLDELGRKCEGKMHDYKQLRGREDYELRLARRRYVLGLEEEAP